MEKPIEKWTRKDFEALPVRDWQEEVGEFDSLVILPTRSMHDSGFRLMDFVAIKKSIPFIRLSGCSDVIHLDGIGGYGHNWREENGGLPVSIVPKGWSIDCLKTSGLLRIFSDDTLKAGTALSSFDLYAIKKNNQV